MGSDAPLSADKDVLADANIFFAIGHPSNPQYRRFRSAVQNAGVVCKLPRRVIGELGGSETDRVRTALDGGWAEIIDAPSPTDGDAVAASDIARRTIANETDQAEHEVEKRMRFSPGWPSSTSETTQRRALSCSLTISQPERASRTQSEHRGTRTRSLSTDWRTSSATIPATQCG